MIHWDATNLKIRFSVYVCDYVYEKTKLSDGKLQAEPAAEAGAAFRFPAEPVGSANDGVFLALEDAGKDQGGAGTPVTLEPGEQMKEKMVIEIGDDQFRGGDGIPQDVSFAETDAFPQPIQAPVPLRLLYRHGIAVPTFHPGSQTGRSEAEDAGATTEVQHATGF